ncbi:hypothetical protein BDD12DRAFT_888503 [Trichophaea hybrida]|nr:hypothetical protein BDD12DRAFT_888503 [Trichophaea hybrida]
MPRKNRSKKGKETQASSSAPPPHMEEVEVRIAAKEAQHPEPTVPSSSSSSKTATVSRRRLPFGERLYESDCGTDNDAPEGQSDDDICINDYDGSVLYDDNEHFHADKSDMKIDPLGVITEYVEETLQQAKSFFEDSILKLRNDTLSQLAERATKDEAYEKRINRWLSDMNSRVHKLEHVLEENHAENETLRAQVKKLESENRELKTSVDELLVEGKKRKEEKAAAATQVVTPPTTPRKDIAIPPAPPKTPVRVVTPLAQQVLKQNMAKRKERSRSDAMEIDNDSAPMIERSSKVPRQVSPTPSLMHSKHATGVDKEEQTRKDKGGRDQQRETGKPRANKRDEGESWRNKRNPKERKNEEGWQEVRRCWRPIGLCTKVNDSHGVTTVWDTSDRRYESWRPHKRESRQQGGDGERR